MDDKVMERFQELMKNDPAMLAFAAEQDVLLSFRLTDTKQDFYMEFKRGQIQAGRGESKEESEVVLNMKSDVLDGIMSGRSNAFTAAMSGKIQIEGDIMKAATFQKILKDLVRIYSKAKTEVVE